MFRHRGFQDKLYWLNFIVTWSFTIGCFILNTLSGFLNITDLAIITYGLPVLWAELGIHTGFIVWKAKVENCRKHKDVNRLLQLESEVDEEDGMGD